MNDNDETGCFLIGMVFAIISLFILYSVIDMNITQEKIDKATEICKNNDGLKHIEWQSLADKVVCNNGGTFTVTGR